MTKEELEKATGQELIDERNYCGVDGYYGDYLENVNAEMLKRFNRLAELEDKLANADYQLEGRDIKIKELEAQIEKMKCCENCAKNGHICVAEEMQGKLCGKNKDKWELRR